MIRKIICMFGVFMMCFSVFACANKDAKDNESLSENNETSVEQSTEDSEAKKIAATVEDCYTYSLDKYMQPYWSSEVIYNESVMPLEHFDGEIKPISLMYDIGAIVSVKSSSLETVYEENKDYIVEDGKLKILSTGAIETVEYEFMYPTENEAIINSNSVFPDRTHGYMYFSEGDVFHNMQLAVTYVPKDVWQGEIPKSKAHLLPKTMDKLSAGEELNVVVYGDSISVGANSSKFVKAKPYCENYFEMLFHSLEKQYGSKIVFDNPSIGGKDSNWGAENAKELVADKSPDLVIIAFGMNDGSIGVSNAIFKMNIRTIMDTVSQSNPNCEYILVAPMIQNKDWPNAAKQALFRIPLNELEKEGCAVADVTSLHEYLLTRKRYVDMTGNHVNHPNDFLVRLYAQVIYELFQ